MMKLYFVVLLGLSLCSYNVNGAADSQFDCDLSQGACEILKVLKGCPSVYTEDEAYPFTYSFQYCLSDQKYIALMKNPAVINQYLQEILVNKEVPQRFKNGVAPFYWCSDINDYIKVLIISKKYLNEIRVTQDFIKILISPPKGVSNNLYINHTNENLRSSLIELNELMYEKKWIEFVISGNALQVFEERGPINVPFDPCDFGRWNN